MAYNGRIMLKRLAVCAMTLALVGFQGNPNPHPKQQAKSSQYPPSPVANPSVQKQDGPSLKQETNQHIDADMRILKSPDKDWYDRTAFWVNVVLAGIGFAGVIIGICTLRYLRKQVSENAKATKAAKDAADAALLNANALIASERPWLLIPLKGNFPDIGPPFLVDRLPGIVQSSATDFRIRNFGSTPGRVIESNIKMLIRKDESIPDISEFDPQGAIRADYLCPPGDVIPDAAGIWDETWQNGTITPQDRIAVESGKATLWLCGRFKYIDTFGRKDGPVYETRLCYRWIACPFPKSAPFWLIYGEYNKAT